MSNIESINHDVIRFVRLLGHLAGKPLEKWGMGVGADPWYSVESNGLYFSVVPRGNMVGWHVSSNSSPIRVIMSNNTFGYSTDKQIIEEFGERVLEWKMEIL